MAYIGWFVVILVDTICKFFVYYWVLLIPILLTLLILIFKRNKIRNFKFIVSILLGLLAFMLFVCRDFGPIFYKNVMWFKIGNSKKIIEEKLQRKYNKNFSFVSRGKVKLSDENSGHVGGQIIDNDYYIIYRFQDDDGVIAVVKYGKNSGVDYYETRRIEYEVEKQIKDYARTVGVDYDFYVYVSTPYKCLNYSSIDEASNYESDSSCSRQALLILPVTIYGGNSIGKYTTRTRYSEAKRMMLGASVYFSSLQKPLSVIEYVVTENGYDKAVLYYESEKVKSGIEEDDYTVEYNFDKDEIITSGLYHLK